MNFPYKKHIKDIEETDLLAEEFAKTLNGGEVIVLNGNLGAGKTQFVKSTARYFNITNVNSPTFAIVNEYYGPFKINHFDFYRINSPAELYNIGIDDYFGEEGSVTFIEWGNLFPVVLPEKRIEISIILNEDFSREFIFNLYDGKSNTIN